MEKRTKNYHKFVATAATATLAVSAFVPVVSADVTPTASNFTDVAEQYKVPVDYLYNKGIIQGISATQFGTQQEIKRVDVGIMIAKSLYTEDAINSAPASGFTDVPARATKYINVLKANGVVNGKTTTSYGANDSITRGEAAIMFANAYNITGDVNNSEFTDVASRYTNAVAALYDHGITKGKGNKKFGTADAITRGELAIFLYKLETLEAEDVKGLNVTKVNEITEKGVKVTIDQATEVDEEATVEVKNAKGEVVEVKPTVIEKGDTEVKFDFKEAVNKDTLDGVWTVNGTAYSFTEIKQLAAIMDAAKVDPLNELNLVDALKEAKLKNIDDNRAASYAKALTDKDAKVDTLEDVQKIIDATNENALTEAEKTAAVEAVQEANSQTQLLEALQKFERINKDWIVSYEADVKSQDRFEAIQEEIDNVNKAEIDKEITKATEQLESSVVMQTIDLVKTYMANDDEDAKETPKADRFEKLGVHMLVIDVNVANTKDKFAKAMETLAEASNDLDKETIHQTLMDNYRSAIQAETTVTNKNAADLQDIINDENLNVENSTLEDLNEVGDTTSEADVLALLQNEALGLEGVVADYAADYQAKIIDQLAEFATQDITKATAQDIVDDVNASQNDEAKLAAVNNAKTASDMRAALIVMTTGTTQDAYANLLTQAKLEVAELVLQAKEQLEDKKFTAETNVLEATSEAIEKRADFIKAVNKAEKITDLEKTLADKIVFPEFHALSKVEKNEKAEAVLKVLNAFEEGEFTTIVEIKSAANL